MLRKLLNTENNLAYTIARIFLGIVILPHGLQKLLGMFGGNGFTNTMNFFTGQGTPAAIAFLIIIGESFGAVALIAGLLGRFCAFGITVIMLGAIFLGHLQYGFFMNWFGKQQGEGFEYHLLAIGLGLIVLLKGSGAFSIDRILVRTLSGRNS